VDRVAGLGPICKISLQQQQQQQIHHSRTRERRQYHAHQTKLDSICTTLFIKTSDQQAKKAVKK